MTPSGIEGNMILPGYKWRALQLCQSAQWLDKTPKKKDSLSTIRIKHVQHTSLLFSYILEEKSAEDYISAIASRATWGTLGFEATSMRGSNLWITPCHIQSTGKSWQQLCMWGTLCHEFANHVVSPFQKKNTSRLSKWKSHQQRRCYQKLESYYRLFGPTLKLQTGGEVYWQGRHF
jgi:hypothetical protein